MLKILTLFLLALVTLPMPVMASTTMQYASSTSWRTSYEQVPIIGDDMGMLGVHYDLQPLEQHPSLYLGLGGYGGLTGEEGGFFTMGLTLGKHTRLSEKLTFDLGLHLGGGGGSRFTFPGGGLIVRPHAALEWQQSSLSWRMGIAQTRFPNSTNPDNDHTHLFVGLRKQSFDWRQGSSKASPFHGKHATFRVSASGLYYKTADDKPLHRDGHYTGNGHNKDIPLLGLRVEQFHTEHIFTGLEFYGAGGGGADGYAAILASLGRVTPLGRYIEWENKVSFGMAGDGRLDTGGGLVTQLSTGFNLSLSKHWYLRASLGHLSALQGELSAQVIDFGIGWQASRPLAEKNSQGMFSSQHYLTIPWVSTISNKTYQPKVHTRNKSSTPYDNQLQLFGFTLSRPLDEWVSLSGSTHWAYDGNIGSYAEGLLGINLHPAIDEQSQWRIQLGYEFGVAGGGVMDIDGGIIHQATAGFSYQINDQLSTALNIGRMESKNRTFQANVALIQLSWHHNSLFLK